MNDKHKDFKKSFRGEYVTSSILYDLPMYTYYYILLYLCIIYLKYIHLIHQPIPLVILPLWDVLHGSRSVVFLFQEKRKKIYENIENKGKFENNKDKELNK